MEWAVTLMLSLSRAAHTPEVPTAPQAHSGILSASKGGPQGPWEECSTHSSRFVPLITLPPPLALGIGLSRLYCPPKVGIGRIRGHVTDFLLSLIFSVFFFVFVFKIITGATPLLPHFF